MSAEVLRGYSQNYNREVRPKYPLVLVVSDAQRTQRLAELACARMSPEVNRLDEKERVFPSPVKTAKNH